MAGKVGGGGGGGGGGRGERPTPSVNLSFTLTTAADVNKFIAVQCNKVDLRQSDVYVLLRTW